MNCRKVMHVAWRIGCMAHGMNFKWRMLHGVLELDIYISKAS